MGRAMGEIENADENTDLTLCLNKINGLIDASLCTKTEKNRTELTSREKLWIVTRSDSPGCSPGIGMAERVSLPSFGEMSNRSSCLLACFCICMRSASNGAHKAPGSYASTLRGALSALSASRSGPPNFDANFFSDGDAGP